ncbi:MULTISPECIES: glycosyltransferase family 2 protein [Arenibacter]|uniref:glycosyltransferase family 2 protein n=1 Tax=Arenibacter TaxID=178469 RepID=UPI000A3B597F|nr:MULTISPECIES: glycosyltransferase family 2 protein [Arenibacter]
MENNAFLVSIVVPCFDEADNIQPLIDRIQDVLSPYQHEIILVNDGSKDATQQAIESVAATYKSISYLSFSRNFGHQTAIKAGIDYAKGDCIVTMDADLQHPPETIINMLEFWGQGFEVITAIRIDDANLPWFKKWSSKGFYWLLSLISDENVTPQGADFRLFDKKIAAVIRNMPENNIYLRGLFSWIGYKQTTLKYKEEKRFFGSTKYSTKKMLKLASNGITSFSIKPLRIALAIGVMFAFLAFGYGVYAIIVMVLGLTVSGWASIVAAIVFLSGLQLMVLGVMGEYIGKLYLENKKRPHYLISKTNINGTSPQLDSYKQERRAAVF